MKSQHHKAFDASCGREASGVQKIVYTNSYLKVRTSPTPNACPISASITFNLICSTYFCKFSNPYKGIYYTPLSHSKGLHFFLASFHCHFRFLRNFPQQTAGCRLAVEATHLEHGAILNMKFLAENMQSEFNIRLINCKRLMVCNANE